MGCCSGKCKQTSFTLREDVSVCDTRNTAIITGVTGQDGSHLADFLLSKNYRVIGLVRRVSTDNTQRIKHLIDHPNFELFEGDVTDYSSVTKLLLKRGRRPVEIYNLAAQSHVGISFKQPGLTWDVTAKGALNILQAIVDLNLTNVVRFYQASSSEMFGKHYDVKDGVKFQNETTRFLPQSPYAIAKCAAHEAVRIYREAYGIHASAGILFNHEGPRRGENFVTRKITKWIGEFVRWKNAIDSQQHDYTSDPNFLLKLSPVSLGGSGNITDKFPKLRLGNLEAFRDWGYVGDYVEAMWMMLQQDKPDDYVICTGETHTIREFLDVAFNLVGINDWSQYVVQDPQFYRPAEVDYLMGDNSKARNKLGWQPKTSFQELVKMMVDNDLQ
jgi:GDPmannose 4,6-dehydratase